MRIRVNENFDMLEKNYLFSEISARVAKFKQENPKKRLISLGIGDVTLPLPPTVAEEMARAGKDMGTRDGFRGYGNTQGLPELRRALADRYKTRGVSLREDEIFINDGAKSDLGNLCDVLGENEALICEPVYPVYLDANVISGRRIRFLCASEENSFVPLPDGLPKLPFVIHLCSPNNPTGAVLSRKDMQNWVDFALESGSLIIFDAAYESFIADENAPHSIFEIEGARECAIEVCSFSKMAGFTGVRCGWTVVPCSLICESEKQGGSRSLNALWKRRQATKFNGASYISQMGALAALSKKGLEECRKNISYYMQNAQVLAALLGEKNIAFSGGENAPYLWLKCPDGARSWQFFDYLLERAGVVGTPGVGFGQAGEGFFRLSAFASHEDTAEAIDRLHNVL